jgi:tetratricopeptide (TPR) repeat protein
VLSLLGQCSDSVAFWATLLVVCCVIILAVVLHILYSLTPARQQARMDAIGRGVMRRNMDRMARYLDGLPKSEPAVRQPFELGLGAMDAFEWDRAIELFREAMLKARGGELVALFDLIGVCHYTRGRPENALRAFEESARLAEQFGDEEGKPPALGNIGAIYHDRGDLDKALQYKEEAWAKSHGLGDQWAEAVYLGNIGNILRDNGDFDRALKYHERALEISRDLKDRLGEATDLANIGSIYRDKGGLDKALRYDREALALARRIGYRLGVVTSLAGIGSVYRYKGKLDAALKYDEEALVLARRIGYRLGEATDLGNIGLVLADKRKYGEAVPKLAEALTILLDSGVADGPRQLLVGLARCEEKLGRKRFEELLKEAGFQDATTADILRRIDESRQATAEAKK